MICAQILDKIHKRSDYNLTRTKVVHKNVSQGCTQVKSSGSKINKKPINDIKVTFFIPHFMKNTCLHNFSIHTNFHFTEASPVEPWVIRGIICPC